MTQHAHFQLETALQRAEDGVVKSRGEGGAEIMEMPLHTEKPFTVSRQQQHKPLNTLPGKCYDRATSVGEGMVGRGAGGGGGRKRRSLGWIIFRTLVYLEHFILFS
uniref:Uncharacterized protein n=1 Tax=Mus musculus TaxID=10090 RepID=Q3UXF8_MOUSE|nr:unnamed protein product [Mus musculus]